MTVKERVIKLIDSLPDTPETDRWLKSIASDLSSIGASNGVGDVKAKKRRRLSFSGIGAGDPPDASERVDEFVGLAVDRRARDFLISVADGTSGLNLDSLRTVRDRAWR